MIQRCSAEMSIDVNLIPTPFFVTRMVSPNAITEFFFEFGSKSIIMPASVWIGMKLLVFKNKPVELMLSTMPLMDIVFREPKLLELITFIVATVSCQASLRILFLFFE